MFIERFFNKPPPINKIDLQKMLSKDTERTVLEFKGGITNDVRDLLKPFVGFANSQGGLIVIGVEDKTKNILGIDDKSGDMRDTIIRKINDKVDPSPRSIYQVIEIEIGKNRKVFLVDVAHSSQLFGVRVRSDDMKKVIQADGSIESILTKKMVYLYFLRGNSETRELTPAELLTVVATKENYDYNLEYRKSIKSICESTISEMARFVEIPRRDFVEMIVTNDMENCNLNEFKQHMKAAKLKHLCRNIYDTILDSTVSLLRERELRMPRDLTSREETAFYKLLEELGYELSLVLAPLILDLGMLQKYVGFPDRYYQSLLDGSDVNRQIFTALSFLTYAYSELRIVGAITRGGRNGLYAKLISGFFSYDVTYDDLGKIISNLESAYKSSQYAKDIDIRKEYDSYPSHLLKALTHVTKPVIDLETATNEVLRLRG